MAGIVWAESYPAEYEGLWTTTATGGDNIKLKLCTGRIAEASGTGGGVN